jgi:hypothetical protein
MADLLGADFGLAEAHKLYACHDLLLQHKDALFSHLTARWRDLFNTNFYVLLYDLTSTYFEINASDVAECDKRRHGYRYHGAGWRPAPWQSEVAEPTTLQTTVRAADPRPEDQTAIHTNLGATFVSLELSRSTWLITSLSPGSGETMSKYSVRGGDVTRLLERFSALQDKAEKRTSRRVPIVVIQEAGLDGFWIHRTLEGEGIESHVVDAASIATSRRYRRAKTDRIDGCCSHMVSNTNQHIAIGGPGTRSATSTTIDFGG